MVKVKDLKSGSGKPGMVPNAGSVISKNKKRKDKRLSQSLTVVKSNAEDIPSRKSTLGPLNKIKENLNLSLNLPSGGMKKENNLLSTSLPLKGGKKSGKNNRLPHKQNAKLAGILSNSNTPKNKSSKVTFSVAADTSKFIDNEAEEGEEPITDKIVKAYEKGSQKRKFEKRKIQMPSEESSDDEDTDSEDEADDSAKNFFDMEASEGEETDESDESLDDEEDDDSSDFIEDGSDEEDDDDSGEDDDDDDSGEDAETDLQTVVQPTLTPARRESVVLPLAKKGKKDLASTTQPIKDSEKPELVKGKIQQQKQQKQQQKQQDVEKKKTNVIEKKNKADKSIQKSPVETENVKLSKYVGFIRQLRKEVTDEAVKAAIITKVKPENIVGIVPREIHGQKKKRHVFVYLNDEDSLNDLLHHKFVVNELLSFTIYKARESVNDKKEKFVAFLPRIPLAITAEELEKALAQELGADAVKKVRFTKVYKNFQTRNALVQLSDVDSLQKIVMKGECRIGDNVLVVRTAFEAGVEIPTYRVLFTMVPEKISEAVLQKAIESQVGKGTVLSVRFSVKKPSYAFVALKTEEMQKKALEVGKNVSVNGTKLQVTEFVPHLPSKKRAPRSQQAKDRKKNKNDKRKVDSDATDDSPMPSKKMKKNTTSGPVINGNNSATRRPKPKFIKKNLSAAVDAKNNGVQNVKQNPSSKNPAVNHKKNKHVPNVSKGANVKNMPQSPPKVTSNGSNTFSPKQKKKNKQANQPSPKPVDAKKKALSLKIENKKQKAQKGAKKE